MGRTIDGLVSRRLCDVVQRRLLEEPVVVLTGPRSVGKSTLLQAVGHALGRDVVDLDDPLTREVATADPRTFATGSAPVLIDEFQHVPGILDAIKAELNRDTRPGRFLLAGSTRYETLPRAAQSLTGRANIVPIWPLSQGEIDGVTESAADCLLEEPEALAAAGSSTTSREEYIERVLAGGMPMALVRRGTARDRWFADYVALVCERDVLELSRVRQRSLLPRLLSRLAAQTGEVLNISTAGADVAMDRSTAENYVKLLEAVFLIHRLPAWGTNPGSRVATSPKVHIVDCGVAASLMKLTRNKLSRPPGQAFTQFGHLLETFVIGEILKQISWRDDVVSVGHWRTRDGAEVDLVLERADGMVSGIEVKAAARITVHDGRHLADLAERVGESWLGGVVLYTGSLPFTLDEARRIVAVPLDRLWGEG
jgi:predicted AAA+ superfamily ATPase